MDLLGIEGQRGPRPDLRRVDRVSAGEGRHGVALGGVREVLPEHVEVGRERGRDDVAPDAGDPLPSGGVVLGDRGERRRVLGREPDDPLDLRDGPLDDDARRHHARGDALPRDLRARLQVPGERPEPLLVAVEVLGGVGPLDRGDVPEEHAGADEVVHDVEPVRPMLHRGEGLRGDRFEHVHRRPEGDVERSRSIVASSSRAARLWVSDVGTALLADVREPVVVAFVADRRRERRLPLEQLFPDPVGECLGAVGVVHFVLSLSVGVTGGQAYSRRRPAGPRRR